MTRPVFQYFHPYGFHDRQIAQNRLRLNSSSCLLGQWVFTIIGQHPDARDFIFTRTFQANACIPTDKSSSFGQRAVYKYEHTGDLSCRRRRHSSSDQDLAFSFFLSLFLFSFLFFSDSQRPHGLMCSPCYLCAPMT